MRGKLKKILMKLTVAATTITFVTPNLSAMATESIIGKYEEHVKGVNVLTEVQSQDGEKVVAIAIEYDTDMDGSKIVGSNTDITSVYSVESLDPNSVASSRTITKVYTNDGPERSTEGKIGKYVIIELDINDSNSGTFYFSFATFLNDRYLNYKVSQIKDLFTADGEVISSSDEKISHTSVINTEVDKFSSAVYQGSEGVLNYSYFTPNVQAGKKYPLVIFLHGAGERGNNTSLQLYGYRAALTWATPENQAKNPSFVFAPQATTDNPDIVSTWPSNKALLEGINDFIANNPVDTNRIYITGMSMGGFGTWSLILNNPDLFAAAVPICGGGDTALAANVVDLPIWTFHGEDDPIVPVTTSRSMVEAIEAAGGTKVKYTEYLAGTLTPNAHNSWDLTYANEEMIEWMYSQTKRKEAVVTDIVANTYVGDAGKMVSSFEITVDDISKVSDIKAVDFDIVGNYDGYPLSANEELVQNNYEDDEIVLTISGNKITMNFKGFKYPGGYISPFAVKCDKYPELSFVEEDVTKVTTKLVDDFVAGTFAGSNGVTLNYRLNLTKSDKAEPLMVWLHGGGEVGTDGVAHITANRGATTWLDAGKETSVLSVQFPKNYGWAIYNNVEELAQMEAYFVAYYELIQSLVASGKVDENRIYLSGASSGGGGALRFMIQYPELFAGAIAICAKDTVADYTGSIDAFKEALKNLKDIPLWIVHAENDPTCDSRTSKLSYEALKELGSTKVKLTLYDDNFMNENRLYGGLRHWSWVPVFNDSEIIDWIYSQSKLEEAPGGEVVPGDDETSEEDKTPVDVVDSNNNGNQENNSNKGGSLPYTGAVFSMTTILLVAASLICSGFLLIRKRVRS